MRMRKWGMICIFCLFCVISCFSSCDNWRNYSLDFQSGAFNTDDVFRIIDYEANPYFTEESTIVLSDKEPQDEAAVFVTDIDTDIYFIFDNLANENEVERIEYGYIANRSITFYVFNVDKTYPYKEFTLYSYDWTNKIYCMEYDFYFEAI